MVPAGCVCWMVALKAVPYISQSSSLHRGIKRSKLAVGVIGGNALGALYLETYLESIFAELVTPPLIKA